MANIIQLMQKVGLTSSLEGVCLGLANTASMAYLLGAEQFHHSLARLQRIYDLDIEDDEAVKQLINDPEWEVMAFLQSVELYQNFNLYQDLQESIESTSMSFKNQNAMNIDKILQNHELEDRGGRQLVGAFTGVYTRGSLLLLLQEFIELCDKQNPPSKQTLMLYSTNHAILIAYDPLEKQWILYNHGDASCAEAKDTAEVVEEIIDYYHLGEKMQFGSNEHIGLSIELHSTGNQLADAEKLLHDWQATDALQMIHHVSEAKTQLKYAEGNSWLHNASMNDNIELIQELINKGTDVDAANDENRTPLFYACAYGSAEVVRCLLDNGANPFITDNQGEQPLTIAMNKKNTLAIKEILAKYPDTVFSLFRYTGLDYNQPSGHGDMSIDEFMMAHAFKTNNLPAFFTVCRQVSQEKRFEKIEKAANSEEARRWMYSEEAKVEFFNFNETSMQRLCEIMRDKPIDLAMPAMFHAENIGEEMLLLSFVHNHSELFLLTSKKMENQPLSEAISRVINLYPPDQRDLPEQWFSNALKQTTMISSPSQSRNSFFAHSPSHSCSDTPSPDNAATKPGPSSSSS